MSDAELLGNELRDARLRLNFTLLQVEKQTKIRVKYLEALEQGNYSMLPSGVHARGFLRAYARFLNLDGDLAVARFDEIMQGGRRHGRKIAPPALVDETPRLKKRKTQQDGTIAPVRVGASPANQPNADSSNSGRRFAVRLAALIAVLAVLFGVGVAGYSMFGGSIRDLLSLNPSGQNTPSGILSPLPNLSPTPLDVTPTEQPPLALSPTPLPIPDNGQLPTATLTLPPPPPGVGDNVLVELRITARTWVQVTTVTNDGTNNDTKVFVGVLGPGQSIREQGKEIRVRVSNAIGVNLFINGVPYGPMGNRGQIAERVYRPGGEVMLTPAPVTPASPSDFAAPTPTPNGPSA